MDVKTTIDQQFSQRHPRLVLTRERVLTLRAEIEIDATAVAIFAELRTRAAAYMREPPPERRLEGRRLLAVSRRVVAHVLTFALLARLTDDEKYAEAARQEMLAAAAFVDWNPSHFLDAAEMATALALGSDWLHDVLSSADRAVIGRALIDKAIEPALSQEWFWFTSGNNWNSVCHAGVTLAALAVAEIDPARSQAVLDLMRRNIGHVAASYGPDGAYDEGPMYWDYGTTFLVLLCAAMESATGEAFTPNVAGLFASADYMTHVVAPSGQFYNYSDCRSDRSPTAALFWLAARCDRPEWAARDRAFFARRGAEASTSPLTPEAARLLPLALIWQKPTPAATVRPANVWTGGGRSPVAFMRTHWDTTDAAFLGIKGGSPGASHGHMDVGSFVYENAGVRWAVDLSLQDYHSLEAAGLNLWDNAQASDRWSVFRLGPEGHGILRMNGLPQSVDGYASLRALEPAGAVGRVEIDLSTLYPVANAVRRTATLFHHGSVELVDRWQAGSAASCLSWQMLTSADVDVLPGGFSLRHGGKTLRVEFECAHAAVAVAARPADSLTQPFDAPNPTITRLEATITVDANSQGELRTRLAVLEPRG